MNVLFNSPIIKKLASLKKVDEKEEKWTEKAIKSLVKKLKKTNFIDELEKAVTTRDSNTRCIIIPRLSDGSLASQRKGIPHVVYCRIWRWPDLQSYHELRSINNCMCPFNPKRDEVCVNPYHYERFDVPSVLVPKGRDDLAGSSNCDVSGANKNSFSMHPDFSCGTLDSLDSDDSIELPNTPPQGAFLSEDGDNDHNIANVYDNNIEMMQELPSPDAQIVSYEEPESWCTLAYYEMNNRVGEPFDAKIPSLTIDGFTSPSSQDRFCIGRLTNVNRTPLSEDTRRLIGRGVHLYKIGGEVFIECLSEAPVFVQSQIANMSLGVPPSTVTKVPSNCNMRIFNNQEFASHLAQRVNYGFDAVYQLMGMCTLRLSFVKGWGQDHSRQAISCCPCWIEIRLTGPLQWLDRVITHMGSPGAPCSSIS